MADDSNVTPITKRGGPKGIVPSEEVGAREHELRLSGKTWAAIAKACGHTSPTAAFRARDRYLQRAGLALSREKRDAALALEIERLDTLQLAFWDAATKGYETEDDEPRRPDVRAAEVILKIIGQRAKMLGLDEIEQSSQGPRTVVVTGNSEQYVATLKALIADEVVDAEIVDDELEDD